MYSISILRVYALFSLKTNKIVYNSEFTIEILVEYITQVCVVAL